MKSYNRIMELFWLSITILILLIVTTMCFLEETERWWQFYFLAIFSAGMWLMRRLVRKRLERREQLTKSEREAKPGTE